MTRAALVCANVTLGLLRPTKLELVTVFDRLLPKVSASREC